jgi:hypothetical protein
MNFCKLPPIKKATLVVSGKIPVKETKPKDKEVAYGHYTTEAII